MLSRLSRGLSCANVVATLALFVDIGNSEIQSGDVKDNTINTFDVHSFLGEDVVDETLTGTDLKNGTLNDEDVGQAAYVSFNANVGTVPADTCIFRTISGIDAQGDHLLLTPDFNTSVSVLFYSIASRSDEGSAMLQVCNTLPVDVADGNTKLNLLVFDAQ